MDKKKNAVFVTGAANGLGKAISVFLANKGFHVIGADNDRDGLEDLMKRNISTIFLDVTRPETIIEAKKLVEKLTDSLDVLVNNAGIFDQIPMVEGDQHRFEHLINVNVLGAFRITHTFFPLLYKRKGQIINISSETAGTLLPFQSYGSSKYMMEAWSEMLRMELKLLGMPVTLIRPGGHKTSLMDKTIEALNRIPEQSIFVDALEKIRKVGVKKVQKVNKSPEEVAQVVYKAILDPDPKRIYAVNESRLYKTLGLVPRQLKEFLVIRSLKR